MTAVGPATLAAAPRHLRRFRSLRDAVWVAVPVGVVMFLVFGLPLLRFCYESFLTSLGLTHAARPFTLDNYTNLVTSGLARTLLVNSVIIGATTAGVCVLVSVALAYWLRYHAGRLATPVMTMLIATVFASYLVRIYAWRTLLGANGVINRALTELGVIHQPLTFLLFDRFAIVLAETQVYLPLMVMLIYAGFRPLEAGYLEVARDLGYGVTRTWRRVILPLMARPIAVAALVAFLFASTDWVAPAYLGGANTALFGVEIRNDFTVTGEWAAGAALSFLMAAGYVLLYALVMGALRLARMGEVTWPE